MKQKIYNLIAFVLMGVGFALMVYANLPIEMQEQLNELIPNYNPLTAMTLGGTNGVLGGAMIVVNEFIQKAKKSNNDVLKGVIDKYNALETKYNELNIKYEQVEKSNDRLEKTLSENTKRIEKNNKLIETDLLLKKDNRFISKEGKTLIDKVLNDEPIEVGE